MKQIIFSFFLSIVVSSFLNNMSYASISPVRAPNDNRIRFVNYDAYNVTKIIGSIRSSVQIEFSPSEEIAHVAIGDSVAWEVAPAGNIIFLKPREVQPITNLQVITTRRDGSKRSYQFELIVKNGEISSESETYFLVKFRYPQDEVAQRQIEAQLKKDRKQALYVDEAFGVYEQHGLRNWAYSAQGAVILKPVSVYDNSKTTTFTFSDNQEIPAIYIVGSDGKESLIPTTTKGNMVVVHAISHQFILRHGANVLCVFNEAYQPKGSNQKINTVSSFLKRKFFKKKR
ncbi:MULTISPECIES: P-type conjugative transfer protein VirB9 [Bartonella]|uniref:P-type conjugative transfer protein VirB9 n=1 Tax=Bartonella TaxID=773 RepID=UPI001ABCF5C0|nr:P-type conjugative transfer protein VirB9 [Bartonella capreoli]